MASRHDIVSITFQANAGKANVALQALQTEAKKSSDRIKELKQQLEAGLRANLPADQIQKIRNDIKQAEREVKQWNNAYKELTKGVRTLDEAVKAFNSGTMGQMSAAFNKAAANAAKLAQSKMTPGTQQWKEMDALIVEAQSNVLKANTAINELTANIQKGGTASKSTLTQAKTDLQQLLTLETRGSAEWNTYNKQLRVVEGELNKLAQAEQKAAQADQTSAMNRRMKDLKTMSSATLSETKRFWETMAAGAEKGSAELAKYEANLKKVQNEERKRTATSAEGVLGNMNKFGIEQVRQAVQQMTQMRDSVQQGIPAWQHYNKLVKQGEAYLLEYTEREKIARGEAVSLADALKISASAGGMGFKGTATQLQQAEAALQKAAAAAKKGSPEWTRYQEALAKVRVEMQNAGMTSERMRSILGKPANAKNLNELQAAVKRAKAELDLMAGTVGKNSKEYAALANQTKKAEIHMKSLQAQSHGTASSFEKAWSRLKTYVGLYVGAAVAMQKLTAAMGDLLKLSDKMGEVRKTTGFTADEVGRLSDNLAKLDTRTSLTQLMELSSLAGSVGLKTQEQVQGFTEAADQLIVALPELGNESARTIIKIANATGDLEKNGGNVRETLEKVGSTIIALRANSASAAGPITDFVSRVGAVGAQAGISIDQIAALGSTIDALGGRVEMSATALSRMIPAIKNNSFAIANSIGVTEKYLKSLAPMEQMVLIFKKMRDNIAGIDTSTEEGMNAMADNVEAFLGKNSTMREVMKDLEQQGARAGIVFGLLSQNVDELEKQLGIASEAYRENTALANEFANMNETTAAKWKRLKNQVEEMFVGDSAQRFLGGIIDGLRKIVDLLAGNGGLSTALHTFIVGWGVFKIGLGELFVKMLPGYLATLKVTLLSTGSLISTYVTGAWAMLKAQIVSTDTATKRMAITWKGLALNRYIIGAWAMLKTHVVQTDIATKRAAISWKAMNASMNANVVLAIVAAIGFLIYKLVEWKNKVSEVEKALAEADTEIFGAQRAVTYLFDSLKKSDAELVNASNAAKKAEESHAALKKEVDELHKSTNLSAEATAYLKQKEDELEDSEKKLAEAKSEVVKQESERNRLIAEINSKYSTYLGYMLSEDTAARNVADAHALIVAALKEEIYQKKKLGLIDSVTGKHEEKLSEYISASWSELEDLPKEVQSKIMSEWQHFIDGIKYEEDKGFILPNGKVMSSLSNNRQELTNEFQYAIQRATGWDMDKVNKMASDWWGTNSPGQPSWMDDTGFRHWTDESLRMLEEISRTEHLLNTQIGDAHKDLVDATWTAYQGNMRTLADMQQNNKGGDLSSADVNKAAQALVGMTTAITKNAEIRAEAEGGVFAEGDVNLTVTSERFLSGFSKENQTAILAAAQKMQKTSGTGGGGGPYHNGSNSPTPYGTYNRVTSPYIDWDADALVSRRKEMLERVRALANGADVQAVLSEDAKFITEATRKNIKTTRDAIEWYNTERLKIQDALHEKHLTNTGDWMDPTGRRKREKTVKDEWSTYLNELDAYYTERKAKIQEQQNDGEISEAESWRRQLTNEAEWRQRRAELQQLYARKSAEVTEEEQQAIFNIIGERTGDSAAFIRASIAKTVQFIYDIGKHSEAEMNNLFGRMDKGSEQDFLRQRNAIGKQMDAIRDIIEKERPFNGITENLQENLTKMGVLFGDMDDEMKRLMAADEDMAEFNAKQEQERVRRLSFLLQEAEHAYNTNIEEVMRHMAEAGMTAWVDYFKNNTDAQNALMAQLHTTFDKVQEAIKKEASLWKKEAENMWNNILLPDGETTLKQLADRTVAALSLDENRVSRANSLIGAGQASERVADRLALQQMRVQLAMQEHYYNIMHQRGRAAIDDLERQAKLARERGDIEEATRKELDAQHARMTLNLATAKEETDLAKQREEIIARTEESQNRLYTAMKEWADLLSSSLQSVFEATHAGDAEYFNERSKLNLTGKGGPGAGTYIIIDNEGTSDATAHYEYLNEREALERQREIANQNALADALKKALDDINMKMSEQITDWINASLQSASLDANTQAVLANTEALYETAGEPAAKPQGTVAAGGNGRTAAYGEGGGEWMPPMEMPEKEPGAEYMGPWTKWAEVSSKATETMVNNNKKVEKSTKASFAAMTAAANMYGIAYQAMSNENLSTAQKVEMMIVQAAGQAAISMLTASLAASEGETAANAPSWISKTLKELGPIGGPVAVGVFTALIGGLMGLATSKITKSKSEIAQVTGASHASAGRLSTGMLQYAEGNVNEFTDPSTLQTGKQYNVDAADGRTYRARFMGKGAKTHITHGPEFHLVGEAGREAIIDAKTTQNIRMNEPEIWRTIQILSGGGRISAMRRRGRGVAAFADGNVDEMGSGGTAAYGESGLSPEQVMAMQASLDRNSEVLERALEEGIKGIFDVYGKDGLVQTYDRGKKTMSRYGKRY